MNLAPIEIERYAEAHTSEEPALLKRINRETHAQVLMPRMLSGHLQGRFLSLISKMLQPKVILEIGTYTGYSALCLAEGLADKGKLITIDANEELESRVRGYFLESPFAAKIDYRIGDARKLVTQITELCDLVFIDADKESNALYYDLIWEKVPIGGVILVDNVLWSGKVIEAKPDKDTRAILEFNQKVAKDTRVERMILPLRDGIFLIRKISH